jgi:hypothetical protein
MLWTDQQQVDVLWKQIALALSAGKLGRSAKVSTYSPSKTTYCLCMYTTDYLDDADVSRVQDEIALALRHVQYSGTIRYKADIYTYLDIYKENRFGLSPTVRAAVI